MNEAVTRPREDAVNVNDLELRRFPPDRLGTLGPRSVWLAGALFWSMIVMSLALQFAEVQRWRDKIENLDPLFADYGLVLLDENLLFGVAPATEAAHKAGIRRGDWIIAVNGDDYSVYTDDAAIYMMTAPQVARLIRDAGTDPITFAVQNREESNAELADEAAGRDTEDKQYWRLVDLKRSPSARNLPSAPFEITRRWVLKGISWTIAGLLFLSAIYLWWKKRRELVNVAVACAIAIYAGRVDSLPRFEEVSLGLVTLLSLVSSLGVGLFIMTLPALPDGRYRPLAARWIMVAGLLVIGTGLLYAGMTMIPWEFVKGISRAYFAIQSTLAQLTRDGQPLLLLIAIALALLKFLRTPMGDERQQVKLITLGLVAGFVAMAAQYIWKFIRSWLQQTSTTDIVIAVIEDIVSVLTDIAPLLIVLGVIASQLRYRLNDADSFISRTAAYGVVTALITTLWGSLTTWTTAALGSVGGAQSASAISAMLAAVVFVPARKRVLDWTESRFQPALVRMRSLPAKIRSLAHDHDPGEIGGAALQATVKGIGARYGAIALSERTGDVVIAAESVSPAEVAAFLARGPENGGDVTDKIELDFPLRVDLRDLVGPVGVLLVGPRSDGAGYSSDEREALDLLKGPLSDTLRATARRASRIVAIAALLERLEARIDAMEARQSG